MLYVDEIRPGDILHSTWIEFVYSAPVLRYDCIGNKCELSHDADDDKSGEVLVTSVSPEAVFCEGRSGILYVFEVIGGMVKLNRIEGL